MKYWYCLFDEYWGYTDVGSATSLKSACAKLRKLMQERIWEAGCVLNADPTHLSEKYHTQFPPSLIGFMNPSISKRRVRVFKALVPRTDFVFYMRKPRTKMEYWPEYEVRYDGTLVPVRK